MKLDFFQDRAVSRFDPWPYLKVLVGVFLTTTLLVVVRHWISSTSLVLLY